MGIVRIFGLVLLAVGILLLIFGYNASQSATERVVEGFTGRFTNQTMWYLIGGVAAVVGGLGLSVWGGRRATT
jgi:divalent metal cation (Fe/Co/Zn/Cd) transporter